MFVYLLLPYYDISLDIYAYYAFDVDTASIESSFAYDFWLFVKPVLTIMIYFTLKKSQSDFFLNIQNTPES